jgi:hypothetical protein
MSSQSTLKPGGVATYSTRPVGLNTYLFVKAGTGDSQLTWHIELCCKDDNVVSLEADQPKKIDVSSAAGALVSARNSGFNDITTWTDY